jgi:hypothetical protein
MEPFLTRLLTLLMRCRLPLRSMPPPPCPPGSFPVTATSREGLPNIARYVTECH